MPIIIDLSNFLAVSPGNLVYILVVAFVLTGSLQSAISVWRIGGNPQALRLVFGLGFLLVLRLILFLVSGLMSQNVVQGNALLPIFERTELLLSLVWIIWLWAFPETSRMGDAASLLISMLVVAGALFSSVAYVAAGPVIGMFNVSGQALFWNLAAILILSMGIGLVIIRREVLWGTGVSMLVLALAGFLLDVIYPNQVGDFSGVVRFFTLAASPLLFSLSSRYMLSPVAVSVQTADASMEKQVEVQEKVESDRQPRVMRERRRYSTDPKTLQTLLALAAEIEPNKVNQFIAKSVAQAMLVDLCFLIYIGDDNNTLYISSGYDLIREENLDGGIVNRETVPMLANAVLKGRPLRLTESATSTDLKGLGDMLGLPNPGNLLNVPVSTEKGPLGSILLLSPYSNRVWSIDDQNFLASIASSFVPIIERVRRITELEQDRERAHSSSKDTIEQSLRLKKANDALTSQIELLKKQLEAAAEEAARQKEYGEQRPQSTEIERPAVEVSLSSAQQLELELRMTLAEMARLQNQLAESNSRILALENENKTAGNGSSDHSEVIASLSQELRQPMSSIIGYADLLLGESVGILGALQRKFIERIRNSTERIGNLVDDLIHITSFESTSKEVKPESVDLNLIIDNAMAYTSSQVREKNIAMRIDIPDNLKPLYADREALQQILIHLLQNAGAVSPEDGSITLRVRLQTEGNGEYVILQVSDSGGGIPKDEIPRVFSRLYRAENALIQGVGDTGVGLSIAKTLTDAQNGRIWVDSEMGVGSTFSVSLPLKEVNASSVLQAA